MGNIFEFEGPGPRLLILFVGLNWALRTGLLGGCIFCCLGVFQTLAFFLISYKSLVFGGLHSLTSLFKFIALVGFFCTINALIYYYDLVSP